MKIHRFITLAILLLFSLPYIYGGCVFIYSSGDLDEDEDNTDRDTSSGFIGISSIAVIDSMNAEKLALEDPAIRPLFTVALS